MTNSPPYMIYADDTSFPVSLEVRNKGVYPSENDGGITADIYFVGFDKNIITGLDYLDVNFDSGDARTRYNPEGGYTMANTEAYVENNLFTNAKIDSYSATIKAVMCYPYKTFVAEEVCVDPNPNRNSNLDICSPGNKASGSQGAPVAVTNIESVAQRGKARFVITIRNVGGGEVIDLAHLGSCADSDLLHSNFNKIRIDKAELSNGIGLDCIPSGDINLINGQATVVCKADYIDDSSPAYNTILSMEISYGYKKMSSRAIVVQGD
jgi:hypothetical protein